MHSTLKAQCTASVGIVYTVTATQKEKLGLNAQASNISTSNWPQPTMSIVHTA